MIKHKIDLELAEIQANQKLKCKWKQAAIRLEKKRRTGKPGFRKVRIVAGFAAVFLFVQLGIFVVFSDFLGIRECARNSLAWLLQGSKAEWDMDMTEMVWDAEEDQEEGNNGKAGMRQEDRGEGGGSSFEDSDGGPRSTPNGNPGVVSTAFTNPEDGRNNGMAANDQESKVTPAPAAGKSRRSFVYPSVPWSEATSYNDKTSWDSISYSDRAVSQNVTVYQAFLFKEDFPIELLGIESYAVLRIRSIEELYACFFRSAADGNDRTYPIISRYDAAFFEKKDLIVICMAVPEDMDQYTFEGIRINQAGEKYQLEVELKRKQGFLLKESEGFWTCATEVNKQYEIETVAFQVDIHNVTNMLFHSDKTIFTYVTDRDDAGIYIKKEKN